MPGFERRHRRERRLDAVATPYIPGAGPITLDAGGRGVLILHGFGDTPQSVAGLASVCHANGWSVRAPALRGHGSTLLALTKASAGEWLDDARNALQQLRSRCSAVAIIGQSMGGAIATILAAEEHIDALVLLVPFCEMSPRGRVIARFHRVVSLFTPHLRSRSDSSILDPIARRNALGRGIATPRLLHELLLVVRSARRSAGRVRAPALVIHSRRDPRISVSDAHSAFNRLGSAEKRLEWVERSGHVISVDYDRDWVAKTALAWIDARARDQAHRTPP
jgi:carboxylesterase